MKMDVQEVVVDINKWKDFLGLGSWEVVTESVDKRSVMYPKDITKEDKYFIGVFPNYEIEEATIYHDRELTDADVIHELLHVAYPDKDEVWINKETDYILKCQQND